VHPPHPELRLRLARVHSAALRRQAHAWRLARSARSAAAAAPGPGPYRRPRRAAVRRRIGWFLVGTGLRLVGSAGRGAAVP